jgi:MFS family permease
VQDNNIWPISLVSFCWSVATLMAASVLPFFLTETLQISYAKVGYIEGMAIFLSFVAKIFAGIFSDWLKKRYILILLGSIVSVITKPMLALAGSYQMISFSRSLDRFAKGIRSAPTDALIADLNSNNLSYAFGLRQALYTLGTVFGAGLAMLIMIFCGLKYEIIFYISAIPAIIAVIILLLFVKDPPKFLEEHNNKKTLINLNDLKKFPSYFWWILFITFFLMIARFSESFLSLKVKTLGWPVYLSPLIFIILDLSHSYFAFISRKFFTKDATEKLLFFGLILLIMANIMWFYTTNNITLIISLVLTGMHLGFTQGVLRTLIATSVSDLYGTAFALFYLVSGCGVLIGNSLAGVLAENFTLSTIFIGGMVASSVALLLLLSLKLYFKSL